MVCDPKLDNIALEKDLLGNVKVISSTIMGSRNREIKVNGCDKKPNSILLLVEKEEMSFIRKSTGSFVFSSLRFNFILNAIFFQRWDLF